jgi:hypothetical protein
MDAEGFTKLVPRQLVVRGASDGVIGPPRTHVSPQLLHGKDGLLVLRAAQEAEVGLDHPKPMNGLQQLSYFCEEQQMSSCEVPIGGWSLSRGVPTPIASMSWSGVGHELSQQLGLFIP